MTDPYRSTAGWSEGPTVPGAPATSPGEPLRYVLGARLGRGAMGEVFEAIDPVLGRPLAVKVLARDAPPGSDRRLQREAVLMAGLDHPGIVAVHDAGLLPDGRPCYAMRLVRGTTLTEAVRAGALGGQAGARVLLAVADALAYAHAAGVIHRDVKPDNVLVGEHGEILLSDWGVARRIDETEAGTSESWSASPDPLHTALGARVGTPAWMAPEVAQGMPAGKTSDVHALGRMLATVLGRDTGGAAHAVDASSDVPADLLSVIARATATDPAARYPDAGAMADDLRAWLDGRPVAAHTYGADERALRFLGRHRAAALVGVASLVLLSLVSLGAFLRTSAALARTVQAEAAADHARTEAQDRLASVLLDRAAYAVRDADLAKAEVLATHALVIRDDPAARGLVAWIRGVGRPTRVESNPLPGRALALSRMGDRLLARDGTGVALWQRGTSAPVWRLPYTAADAFFGDDDRVIVLRDASAGTSVVDAADGQPANLGAAGELAVIAAGRGMIVIDRATRAPIVPDACAPRGRGLAATEAPDHRRWLLACTDGRLLRGGDGHLVTVPLDGIPPGHLASIAWMPDDTLVVGTVDGDVVRLGPAGARRHLAAGALLRLLPSPNGERLAVAGDGGVAMVLDARTLAPISRTQPGVTRLAITDDELVLANGHWERWQLPSTPGRWFDERGFSSVAIRADGRVAAAQAAGQVRLFDVPGLVPRGSVQWQSSVVLALGFRGDGHLWSASYGGPDVVTVEARDGAVPRIPAPTRSRTFRGATVLHDGTRIESDFVVALQRVRPDGARERLPASGPVKDLSSSPSGLAAAAVLPDGTVWRIGAAGPPVALGVVPDGVAVALDDTGTVWVGTATAVVRLRDGQQVTTAMASPVSSLATDSAGTLIVVGGLGGHVTFLDHEARVVARASAHEARVSAVAVDAGGHQAISAGWDGVVQAWDIDALHADPAAMLGDAESRTGLDLATLIDGAP